MNNNAGVVGNAPMTPAFFLFLGQNVQVLFNVLSHMARFRVATALLASAWRSTISP